MVSKEKKMPTKVIHIESGLGNQMLDYAELLAVKKSNPLADIYIETIISEMPDAGKAISQWNGFELKRIFKNISDPNISDIFPTNEWKDILLEVENSRFWEKHWDYPPAICGALNSRGLVLQNRCVSLDNYRREDAGYKLSILERLRLCITYFFRTPIGNVCKRFLKKKTKNKKLKQVMEKSRELFSTNETDEFLGHNMIFMYKDSGIEKIDSELRHAFEFPDITGEKNLEILDIIRNTNSVAIHARRGDMLKNHTVKEYYQFGYFKRAVRYIKKHVNAPVFIFFCDPGSEQWCRENIKIFSLDFYEDKILFVNWNKGDDSYKDMQLMSCCKHNIITNSSFGWWAAYLNNNPGKITISPEYTINTTVNI